MASPDHHAPPGPTVPQDSRVTAAAEAYRTSPSRESLGTLARLLYEAGRHAEALESLESGKAAASRNFFLVNLRGAVLRKLNRHDEALAAYRDAARLDRKSVSPYINAANVHLDRREPLKAVEALTQAVQRDARSGLAQKMLGRAHRLAGNLAQARRRLELARQLTPADAETWSELADVISLLDEPDRAIELLDKAIATLGPMRPLLLGHLVTLRRAARHGAAIEWLDRQIERRPDDAWLHFQLGRTLTQMNKDTAVDSLRRAVALAPGDAEMLAELADRLNRLRGPNEADNIAEAYALALQCVAIGGDLTRSAREIMNVLVRCADYDAADKVGSFEGLGRYWATTDNVPGLHTLIPRVRTAEDRRSLVAFHRMWGRKTIAQAERSPISPAPAIGGAKIRIGFMSSDLRDHPVAYFAAPLLLRLDRTKFEINCYSWTNRPADAVQRRLEGAVDRFVHDPLLSDREAAQLIASDGLDVLFELGGSTDQNKLRTMAWRPAPRQASWLGYPHSSGLETIDRIVTDPYITPEDPALLIERPLELRHSWVAFEQPGFGDTPGVDPDTPEARTGIVTFGTFNNPQKYTRDAIAAWARIMAAVPNSRFLFVRPEGGVAPFRANIEKAFAQHGIAPDRIAYTPVRGAHLRHYNAIDISLDTFPQTGGTTTCESLYMGVPVVTLVGDAFFERLTFSNLSNAGLGEYCARTIDDYVAKAVALAADRDWRTEFRRMIGERLRTHPIGRVDDFTGDFEQAVIAWMDERPR